MKTISEKFTVTTNEDGTYRIDIENSYLLENKDELRNYLSNISDNHDEFN